MTQPDDGSRARRRRARAATVTAASVALHLALALAFVLRPEPAAMAAGPDSLFVTLVSMPAGAAPEEAEASEPEPVATPDTQPPEAVAEATAAVAEVAPPDEAAASEPSEIASVDAGAGGPVGACAISQTVMEALKAKAPRAALDRIPQRRRSVANALMLWDGRWVRDGALADARIAQPIRQAIAEAVRSADPGCAAQSVSGPTLLIIPDQAGSLVLVVGSGSWRWADLTNSTPS